MNSNCGQCYMPPGKCTCRPMTDEDFLPAPRTHNDRMVKAAAKASSPSVEPAPERRCPKCGKLVVSSAHGEYCPDAACKWGWEVEMDGSPLKPEPSVEMRERFEDWIERELPGTDLYIRSDGHYGDLLTAYLWKGWQARAASQGAPHDCKGVLCPKCQTIIMGHGCCDSK